MSPLTVLALTFAAATLVVIAVRPYLGLHAFIMLLFVENVFASREGVTAMKLLGIIIFCGWLLSTGVRRRLPLRFDSFTISVLAFLAWSVVTLLYAIDTGVGASRTFTYLQLGAASMMFVSVVDDPLKLRGVFRALLLWSLLATCAAIAGYYFGITSVAVGFTGNRNLLATYINVGIVCAFLLYQRTAHSVMRFGLLLSVTILVFGLAVTFSRTGLIVLGASLLVLWWRVAQQRKFGVLLGSIGALCVIALLLPGEFYQRAGSIVPVIKGQGDTFGTRVRLWNAGLRMIEDRPLLGVGPGNFVVAVSRYSRGEILLAGLSAHNAYISVAAEMGLIGLALFGLVLSTALWGARRVIRGARDPSSWDLAHLAVMGEISMFVILGAGMSATVEHLKLLWLLIGTCGAVGRMALQDVKLTPGRKDLPRRLEA
jgi:O-antigen ligase